jgi:hypothetical protein
VSVLAFRIYLKFVPRFCTFLLIATSIGLLAERPYFVLESVKIEPVKVER